MIGLEQGDSLVVPFTKDAKAMYFHFFSDASLKNTSYTGGVGMLGGGPIYVGSRRQHLAAPDSHSAEVVAGGDNMHTLVAINGVLQEVRIRLGTATPFYFDSKTSVFVAQRDSAIKKSVWLTRRAVVLQECVELGEGKVIHISERDMVADLLTKYLTYPVWNRLISYLLNRLNGLECW